MFLIDGVNLKDFFTNQIIHDNLLPNHVIFQVFKYIIIPIVFVELSHIKIDFSGKLIEFRSGEYVCSVN